jgi:glycosyltransferase involved in cell wall biosynthesis
MSEAPMRLLVQDFSGHPFQAQLSRALAARGHEVVHSTCSGYASGHGDLERKADDPPTLRFEHIGMRDGFQKYSLRRRVPQELAYGWRLVRLLRRVKPDAYLSCNEPLLAKAIVGLYCWATRRRWIYWLQDLYSVAMRAELTRMLGRVGSIVGRCFEWLERWLVRKADGVVLISHAFEGWLLDHGIHAPNIAVIPNWAPLDEIEHFDADQGWFQRVGIPPGAPVALYSGTLGRKHDAGKFLVLAERIAPIGGHIVVISQGAEAEVLAAAASGGLSNLHVLPFQPWEELPAILASASVLLAVLHHEAAVFSVPSKVLTYLCAGRPIVAAMTATNLAAAHIHEAEAGLVTDPDDDDAFAAAVLELLADPERREKAGRSARAFAERAFDIGPIADRFEDVIDHARHPRRRALVAEAAVD